MSFNSKLTPFFLFIFFLPRNLRGISDFCNFHCRHWPLHGRYWWCGWSPGLLHQPQGLCQCHRFCCSWHLSAGYILIVVFITKILDKTWRENFSVLAKMIFWNISNIVSWSIFVYFNMGYVTIALLNSHQVENLSVFFIINFSGINQSHKHTKIIIIWNYFLIIIEINIFIIIYYIMIDSQ